MAETGFRIVYQGPALTSGRMPVRDLAPALLALGNLFAEASDVLYPDREPVALSLTATDRGSFEAHLILEAKKAWDQVVDIFGSTGATAIVNLKDTVILLFLLILQVRRRKIVTREQVRSGWVRITLDDGTSFDVSADALKLSDRVSLREKARDVLEPLNRDGVDRVTFRRSPDQDPVDVSAEDLPAFDIGDDVTVLGEQDLTLTLQIAAVAFVRDNKWRLSDGTVTFWATIEDREFLASIDRGESFAKGDLLRCVIHVTQTQDSEGDLRTEHRVLRVLQHMRRLRQLELGDESSDSDSPES